MVNKNSNLVYLGLSCENPVEKEKKRKTIGENNNLKRKGILD